MEDAWSDDAPGGPHEIPGDEPEGKHEHNYEQKSAWRVGYSDVGNGKDSRLKNVRHACAEEPLVFLKEQTSEEKFFFEETI